MVLIGVWLVGMVTKYTIGGFVHVLLGIAIVVGLLEVVNGGYF
jgi:hypothetical protein